MLRITLIVAIMIAVLALCACSSSSETTRVLESAGYTNIKTTGYQYFGCSEDDAFHTGFEATGRDGQKVSGVVCSGWLKGATIRID